MNYKIDVKTFEDHVNKYFNKCELDERQPTMNGLALHLDLTYKQLKEYSPISEFYPIVQKAISRIAIGVEENLLDKKNFAGNLQWLKVQQDWVAIEKQEIKNDGGLNININADRKSNL